MTELELSEEAATRALGRALGRTAPDGAVIALVGDLGAGKTVLAQGVGEGLDVPGPVASPTFVLVQVHTGGRRPFVHADLYRLDRPDEVEQTGLVDLIGEGVAVIEWAERAPEVLPDDHLRVELTHAGAGRRARLHPTGPAHAAWLEAALAAR